MHSARAARRALLRCVLLIGVVVTPPGLAEEVALSPVILADTNRDGVVDDADREGKTTWTALRGAILLPNIGDKARRCPSASTKDWSDAELERCNDAEGNEARAPEYFAPVRTVPLPEVSSRAFGHVVATGPGADKIRIFIRRGGRWAYLAPTERLSAAELKKGATLGVDSRDVIRDASVWDGSVTLEFRVSDRGATAGDRVAMRVAPVIVHHHLEQAVEAFAPQSGRAVAHQQFMVDLSAALAKAGFERPIRRFNTTDNWAQDFVEFGYVSMPAPGGGVTSIRIALRSPQPDRSAGRSLFDIRGPGMGVVQIGGEGYHQVDSFGNLETVPPYEHNGKSYPVGRVIYGDAGDGIAPHKDFVTFFKSQGVQAPIVLDTSWLAIGHVDEFVQFLPADNARGWTIAIKDVQAALDLLREAQARGHGNVRAFSREGAPELTIDELLSDTKLLRQNELARRKIELNLAILKAETGVSDDEVVRVPGLFHASEFSFSEADAPPPALPEDLDWPREKIVYGPGTLLAFYPAAVNGLLLDRHNYIVPTQWGPAIDGVDILQAAVNEAYAKVGIKAWTVDDWLSHHRFAGEIHCGTNVTREISRRWWARRQDHTNSHSH
jgi:protein-arginine deiminase